MNNLPLNYIQMQEKVNVWYRPGFRIKNLDLQLFADNITALLEVRLANGLKTFASSSEKQDNHTDLLNRYLLTLLLISFPQDQVRKFLKSVIKHSLHELSRNIPGGIGEGPIFYPRAEICNAESQYVSRMKADDVERLKKISEAILLYNTYTADPDFLTSEGFNIQLKLSRFWASFLSKPHTSSEWIKENGSLADLQTVGSEMLKFTLSFIAYLKAENSWMYEDLREQNKFSELKETACWRKIIQKEIPGSGALDFLSGHDTRIDENSIHGFINNNFQTVADSNLETTYHAEILVRILKQCTGFSISDNVLTLNPGLPPGWEKLNAGFHFRKSFFELAITPGEMEVSNHTQSKLELKVNGVSATIAGLGKKIFNY